MVPQKPQVWSSCKAHDAMEWQRHFERHATPQMGRNCGFWAESIVVHEFRRLNACSCPPAFSSNSAPA
jgi:hypothetical protein